MVKKEDVIMSPESDLGIGSKRKVNFCHEPSDTYLDRLEEYGDDPRSVIGHEVLSASGPMAEKGWIPSWDSRESRR